VQAARNAACAVAGLAPGDVVVLAYEPPEAGPSAASFLAVRTVLE